MAYIWGVLGLFLALLTVYFGISFYLMKRVLKPVNRTQQHIYEREIKRGIDEGIYKIPNKLILIKSRYKYSLSAHLYSAKSNKFVIISHGLTDSYYSQIKYADFFVKLGINALLVNLRTSEQTGGKFLTYGAKESDDILNWISYLKQNYPNCKIGVMGESMGGATSILAASKVCKVQETQQTKQAQQTEQFQQTQDMRNATSLTNGANKTDKDSNATSLTANIAEIKSSATNIESNATSLTANIAEIKSSATNIESNATTFTACGAKDLEFLISYCSYSSFWEILKTRGKEDLKVNIAMFKPALFFAFWCFTGKMLGSVNLKKAIAKVTIPTLLLHNYDDNYVPYSHAEMLLKENNNAKLHSFKGAKHVSDFYFNNKEMTTVIKEFLAEINF